jgi:hypothetical protein
MTMTSSDCNYLLLWFSSARHIVILAESLMLLCGSMLLCESLLVNLRKASSTTHYSVVSTQNTKLLTLEWGRPLNVKNPLGG